MKKFMNQMKMMGEDEKETKMKILADKFRAFLLKLQKRLKMDKFVGGEEPLAGDFCIAALCLEIIEENEQILKQVLDDFPSLPTYLSPFLPYASPPHHFSKSV